MSTSHYQRTTYEEVTYVSGGDVAELRAACIALDFADGATWTVEDGAIVFSVPMGSQMVGGTKTHGTGMAAHTGPVEPVVHEPSERESA